MTGPVDAGHPLDPLGLLKRRKPREVKLAICVDDDLADIAERAARARDDAEYRERAAPADETARDTAAEARTAADTAQADVDAATVVFTFRGIGAEAWGRLMDEHAPTPEQTKRALERGQFGGLRFNPDTFQPAAIAACATFDGPDGPFPVPLDVVTGWYSDPAWSDGDLDTLFTAAADVNSRAKVGDWGKGSGTTAT